MPSVDQCLGVELSQFKVIESQEYIEPRKPKEMIMSLLERIKATIFGEAPPAPPRTVEEENDDIWTAMRRAADAHRTDVSTPADDPIMDDVSAAGVQPVSKPADIEEAQNPKRRPIDRFH